MRKLSFLTLAAAATLCLASCEPEVFSMLIDVRQPSKSGINLAGKTMSVVYMDDLSGRDTVFNAMVAEGFAKALEEDYFGGEEAVNIYRMEKDMAGVYSSKDTLVNVAVRSGDDVVFLFDSPSFGDLTISEKSSVANASEPNLRKVTVKAPFKLDMYVYNTMGKDTVNTYRGSSSVNQQVLCKDEDTSEDVADALWASLGQMGETTGKRAADKFVSTWESESFYFYFYDYNDAWMKGVRAAYEYRWHDAIDAWMELLDSKNMARRAAAEYDIAQAFFLLGDYEMAQKWLDQSNKECRLPLNAQLQRNIINKKAAQQTK